MDLFAGFTNLEDTLTGTIITIGASDTPTNADALPTFRVYGPSGFLISGTVSFRNSGTITGVTNTSPIVVTSAAHGLTTGTRVTITGVGGTTAANTTAIATFVSTDTFSIPVAGDGAYTSGGLWSATGLYKYTIAATAANGFASGLSYDVVFNFSVASVQKGVVQAFQVS